MRAAAVRGGPGQGRADSAERPVLGRRAGKLREKDTKTHQQRRVALDAETVDVLRDQLERREERASVLGSSLPSDGYVFSRTPLVWRRSCQTRPPGVSVGWPRGLVSPRTCMLCNIIRQPN